jgi:Spy/CpxP family protein refolding chaperone
MNRIRLLAIGSMLMFALTTVAQATTSADGPTKGASAGPHAGVPTAEVQLKFLAAKLDLTGDQQEKIKPALQELHDATVKLVQDENMSREERLSKVRDSRYVADKKIRAILNDEQKQKLDQVEQEPHPELHGSVSGPKN